MTPQQILESAREEFYRKFAKISHIHRGEYAITDATGTQWQAHTENGVVTEVGGLESVLDWHTSTLQSFIEAEIALINGLNTFDTSSGELIKKEQVITHLKKLLVTLKR